MFQGSYGYVFQIKYNGNDCVIKLPKRKDLCSNIEKEGKTFQILSKYKFNWIPKFYYTGILTRDIVINIKSNEFDFTKLIGLPCIIIQFINGKTLDTYTSKLNKKQVMNYFKQVKKILYDMYSIGILYIDVKPENFIVKRYYVNGKLFDKIYCIDFGLLPESKDQIIGTPRYMSLAAHKGTCLKLNDLLQSGVYMLLFLYYGSLPWQYNGTSMRDGMVYIYMEKSKVNPSELCKDFPQMITVFS